VFLVPFFERLRHGKEEESCEEEGRQEEGREEEGWLQEVLAATGRTSGRRHA
jgi:hypothetical protein